MISLISLESFSTVQQRCVECELLNRGRCSSDGNDTCRCFTGYEGEFCHSLPLTKATTNWTAVVGVISGIAGFLLIIAICLCFSFINERYPLRHR